MKQYLLIFLCLCACSFYSFAQQVTPPTVQACGTAQQFCLTDDVFPLCVKISVTQGLPSPIDHFEITWGDGSAITTVPGSMNPLDQTHDYDFENFYNTCSFEIEYFIELETFLENGAVLNLSLIHI